MLWRFQVIGTRTRDKRPVELMRTFSYDQAMNCLTLYHRHYREIYSEVVVEFPWWSFILQN